LPHDPQAGQCPTGAVAVGFVCQLSDTRSELSLPARSSLVSEAVDLVVHCARHDGFPRVAEVVAVEDLHVGPETVAYTTTSMWERPRRNAGLACTSNRPVRASRALERASYDVRALVDATGGDWPERRSWPVQAMAHCGMAHTTTAPRTTGGRGEDRTW
jgi:pilus assembly protein CpaF